MMNKTKPDLPWPVFSARDDCEERLLRVVDANGEVIEVKDVARPATPSA